jgi:hypothetical protein
VITEGAHIAGKSDVTKKWSAVNDAFFNQNEARLFKDELYNHHHHYHHHHHHLNTHQLAMCYHSLNNLKIVLSQILFKEVIRNIQLKVVTSLTSIQSNMQIT